MYVQKVQLKYVKSVILDVNKKYCIMKRVLVMCPPQEQACLLEADMLEYMPACKGVKRLAGQGHRLGLAFSSTTGLCLCVYLAVPQRGQFTVLQLVATDNNRYSLDHISSLFTTQVHCRFTVGSGCSLLNLLFLKSCDEDL